MADAPAPRLAGEFADLLDGSSRMEDFIAAIVHEAAQPLTAIQMLTAALRQGGDAMPADERDRLLEGIEGQARFMRDLADWMIDPFARAPAEFDVLVADAVERCRPLVQKHEIVLQTGAAGLNAECERVRVEASIRNLICNATRHVPAGGRVTISTLQRDGFAVVGVSDQGEGIPREQWENIFKPYVRLSEKAEGTGLGLFLVRSCAERHGGFARVGASGPEGTTMEFGIPASG